MTYVFFRLFRNLNTFLQSGQYQGCDWTPISSQENLDGTIGRHKWNRRSLPYCLPLVHGNNNRFGAYGTSLIVFGITQ